MAKGKQLQPIEADTLEEALRRQQVVQGDVEEALRRQRSDGNDPSQAKHLKLVASQLLETSEDFFYLAKSNNNRARAELSEATMAFADAKYMKETSSDLLRKAEDEYAIAFDLNKRLEAVQRSREAMAIMDRRLDRDRDQIEIQQKGKAMRVRRTKTTAQKLVEGGHLPPDLKIALEAFAMLVADAIDETGKSMARLSAKAGGAMIGSKSTFQPHRVTEARKHLREVAQMIPPELREIFIQLIGEEVGHLIGKPLTLGQIGQARGYIHKQSSAAGGAQCIDVVCMIAHFCSLKGLFSEEHLSVMRQNVADRQQNGGNQPLLTDDTAD